MYDLANSKRISTVPLAAVNSQLYTSSYCKFGPAHALTGLTRVLPNEQYKFLRIIRQDTAVLNLVVCIMFSKTAFFHGLRLH